MEGQWHEAQLVLIMKLGNELENYVLKIQDLFLLERDAEKQCSV